MSLLYEKESYEIRGACFWIWKEFGSAFKESIIDKALTEELLRRGLKVENQKRIDIFYQGKKVGTYIPDKIVNDSILIELKAKPFLTKSDYLQFQRYLKGSNYKLGFLINFGNKLTIKRYVYDKIRKDQRQIRDLLNGSARDPRFTKEIRERSAFTLVELLITIGILAILAGIGFISIVNYREQQDLTSTTQEIVEVLRNAQNRSLSQEATSTTGTGGSWGVYFENPNGDGNDFYELFQGSSYASGTVVSRSNLPFNVQFNIPASGSSSTVIFSPITGLPDSATTIKISLISNPTSSSTIMVNANGKIQY